MKKAISFVLALIIIAYFSVDKFNLEQDLLSALDASFPEESKLFRNFQADRFSKNKIFIELQHHGISEQELEYELSQSKYFPTKFIALNSLDRIKIKQLIPYFNDILDKLEQANFVEKRFNTIRDLVYTPGSSSYLKNLDQDPLGMAELVVESFMKSSSFYKGRKVLIFERKGPLDFNDIQKVESYLKQFNPKGNWTGADFFALANYTIIKRDILFCSIASLVFGLLIFYYLCPSISLLAILIVGTSVSYVFGLLAVSLFYSFIFTIVLTFTSTFVGFNNEYLIHFSGIKEHSWKALVGLGSAIGTTLIGFLILLFSRNPIISQIGVVSIAGMIGFLSFLFLFQNKLKKIEFRKISLPYIKISSKFLVVLWTIILPIILLSSHLNFATNIEEFRFAPQDLEKRTENLNRNLENLNIANLYAIPTKSGEIFKTFDSFRSKDMGFHPLNLFKDLAPAQLLQLSRKLNVQTQKLDDMLKKSEITLKLGSKAYHFSSLKVENYLDLWSEFTIDWLLKGEKQRLFLTLSQPKYLPEGAVPLFPKGFYNWILTTLQGELIVFFLIGLLVMAFYLVPWQRDFMKILYIFTPLFLSFAVMILYVQWFERSINIIHTMGFSLVIALSLDYSAILVSSRHAIVDLSKVIITGLMALSSFSVLIFADHPVIHDLGITVTIGTTTSLIFCLFFRLEVES